MKVMRLFVLALLSLTRASAYTAKKREQRRPAFGATSVTSAAKEETTAAATSAASGGNTAAFTSAPGVGYAAAPYHQIEELEEEELIGYGTAIVSCVLSLALGFGLGYGT